MARLDFSARCATAHAPLVQRVAAVIAGTGPDRPPLLHDAREACDASSGRMAIALRRDQQSRIDRRPGANRLTLNYSDPASEATLAALIACAAPGGAPIVADPESLATLALAERLAASEIPVLIDGPTGTGKEVLSRFIHARSPRAGGPFVAVNCAAMPEAMLEALLFGHRKGAFTGASEAGQGFFRAADGGTLLLDEIAEMPLGLQAKLLRALQEGEVVPIGETRPVKVDVRVIACANRDLPGEVAAGRFRADLFYRLNVFPLSLRALRERREDIAPLAFALLLRHTPRDRPVPWIADAALVLLRDHGWPGNVRELENVIRRALLLAGDSPRIEPEHIRFDGAARLVGEGAEPAAGGRRLASVKQSSEARAIMEVLASCGGNRLAAARELGISERTLRYRLASYREAGILAAGGRR